MTNAPYIVTLGTAGGPRWWTSVTDQPRFGIATAVVVGDRTYLVDAGIGAGRQLARAGLAMNSLGGIFLTHLHSDHTTDLANIALFGMFGLPDDRAPIPIIGPGDRGELPPVSPRAEREITPVAPHRPTPGTADMFRLLMEAYATDLNDRVLDALRPSPLDLFDARDIAIPPACGYHPNENMTPPMDPFCIFEDDRVRVEAILVEHPPIAPAFGFRISTEEGTVVFSGDTAKTANMVRLARDADLLLHEAISFEWVEELYGSAPGEMERASRDHHYKSHTSVEQAIDVAYQAGARHLTLHHLVPGHRETAAWRRSLEHSPVPATVAEDLQALSFIRDTQSPDQPAHRPSLATRS